MAKRPELRKFIGKNRGIDDIFRKVRPVLRIHGIQQSVYGVFETVQGGIANRSTLWSSTENLNRRV
ncbi:MAG: hypothetical protein CBC13_05665 [Planctomycetia bacterium TMED53]|nr:MAG: hypothetical protein CBC13_05665 [Planctomycetia bacterium TMED53]